MGLLSGEYNNQLGCWLTAKDGVRLEQSLKMKMESLITDNVSQ